MKFAKKDLNKDKVLSPLVDIITGHENLNFLDNNVEKRVRHDLSIVDVLVLTHDASMFIEKGRCHERLQRQEPNL